MYVKMHVLFLARVRSRARSRLMSWYTQHRAVLANAAMSYQLSGTKTDLDWDDVLVDLSWFVEEDATFWKPDKVYEKMELHFGVLVKVNHTIRSYTFPTAAGSDKLAHVRACARSRLLSWYTQNRAALARPPRYTDYVELQLIWIWTTYWWICPASLRKIQCCGKQTRYTRRWSYTLVKLYSRVTPFGLTYTRLQPGPTSSPDMTPDTLT